MANSSLSYFVSLINHQAEKHESLLEQLCHAEALTCVANTSNFADGDEELITNYIGALHSFVSAAVDNCKMLTQELFAVRGYCFRELSVGQGIENNRHFVLNGDDVMFLAETIKQQLRLHENKLGASSEIYAALNTIVGLGYAATMSSNGTHAELQHCFYDEHMAVFLQTRDVLENSSAAIEIVANCVANMIDIAAASFVFSGRQYFNAFRNSLLIVFGSSYRNCGKISKILDVITLR